MRERAAAAIGCSPCPSYRFCSGLLPRGNLHGTLESSPQSVRTWTCAPHHARPRRMAVGPRPRTVWVSPSVPNSRVQSPDIDPKKARNSNSIDGLSMVPVRLYLCPVQPTCCVVRAGVAGVHMGVHRCPSAAQPVPSSCAEPVPNPQAASLATVPTTGIRRIRASCSTSRSKRSGRPSSPLADAQRA